MKILFRFVICRVRAFATEFKVDPMFTPESKTNMGGTLTLRLAGSPQSRLFRAFDNNAYTVCYNRSINRSQSCHQ